MTFIWWHFHKRYLSHQSLKLAWKLFLWNFTQISRGPMSQNGHWDLEESLGTPDVNSLWPSDAIMRQRTESTLALLMACCLMAPSHYLNQCWLIISKVLWHSSEDIIIRSEDTKQLNKIENSIFRITSRSPRGQWVNDENIMGIRVLLYPNKESQWNLTYTLLWWKSWN